MPRRSDIVEFLIGECFGGDRNKACVATGFTMQQMNAWCEHQYQPQAGNVSYLMHRAFAPEFRVIAEYVPIEMSARSKTIRGQLAITLKGHEKASGLYAFYDSMASLVYLGKSDGNLLAEVYQQLNACVRASFPKGVRQPKHRLDVVRYISAYYVRKSDFEDYAKHVKSLILRISKPVLNANIGKLKKA